jgi:serine/threonine-protein kinase
LHIAKQITEGLEYAHERGVIHRDLKPANVKVRPDGTVKILDFGLAKALDPQTSAPGVGAIHESPLPTISAAATREGMILGTAAYMSPEQARGKTVDRRCDIWSFGAVLFEMLSGKQAFAGEDVSQTLATVIMKEPDWSVLPHELPTELERLLRRCLVKDLRSRLQAIGEARIAVEETLTGSSAVGAVHESPLPQPAPLPIWRRALPWALAVVVALAVAVALWAPWRPAVQPTPPLVRLDLDLGPDVSLGSATGPAVILSPDGTRLVFSSQDADGTRRLFTRPLDQPKVVPLSGTEGASAPFFSPDGQWVGFFAQGKLKKTRIDGGQPVSLCDAPSGRGASWGENGTIIAALDAQVGLSQVPAEGGKAVSVTKLNLEIGENTHRWPQILPGGKAVLFNASIAYGNYDEAEIAVVSLRDHRRKAVLEHAGMYPRYLPSGHLVYVTKGTLFAVPFDPDRLEVQGTATPLQEVSSNVNLGSAQLDFSRSGILAYRIGGTEGLRTIQWLDGAGKTVSFATEPAFYSLLIYRPTATAWR